METKTGSESQRQPRGKRRDARPSSEIEPKVVGESDSAQGGERAGGLTSAEHLAPGIEALLLSVDRAIPAARIGEALGLIAIIDDAPGESEPAETGEPRAGGKKPARGSDTPVQRICAAIALLNQQYEATGRSFRIEKLAGGYRVMTLPVFANILAAHHGRRERQSLSRAAIETLSIVAYKQPVTRVSLEAIRGVACGEVLRSLTERRLVTIVGRAEEVGRPILYGTTKQFLELFGLASLRDLPSVEEFKFRSDSE